jgi:hypothetical protein
MLGPSLIAAFLTLVAPAAAADPNALASAAPPTMQWQVQELTVVRRVAPAYPSGVPLEEVGDVACRAAVRIAGDGVPNDVAVEGCPVPFAQATQKAISDWRWAAWGSLAERRVTLTVRFPRPTRLGVTAPLPADVAAGAVPSPAPSAVPVAPVAARPTAPVVPTYTEVLARGVAQRVHDGVVCTAEIVRNRQGGAVKASLGACPDAYRQAAAQALEELRRKPGRPAERGAPARRTEDVRITFQVTEV